MVTFASILTAISLTMSPKPFSPSNKMEAQSPQLWDGIGFALTTGNFN